MAPSGAAGGIEHRLTKVESDLANHMKTCEANSNEIKWWVRSLGLGALCFLAKLGWDWLAAVHH